MGRSLFDLVHPDDRATVVSRIRGIQDNGDITPVAQVRLLALDGSDVMVEAISRPVLFEGRPAVQTAVRDITEAWLVRSALIASERRYAGLVDNLDGIVWEVDARTFQFRFVSRQAERILGYPVSRWLEEPNFWRDHIDPEDREWAIEYRLASTRRGVDHDFEYRMIAADGRVVWLDDIVSVESANGEAVTLRGVMVGITARKQAEIALRRSQTHLMASQRIARVGSWELDLASPRNINLNRLRWTDESFRVFGYEPGAIEASNEAFWARVHPDDRPKIEEAVRTALETRSVYELDHRIVLPDGSERVIHEHAELELDPKTKKPLKFIGTAQDVTERRQAEEALRASETFLRLSQESSSVGSWEWDIVDDQVRWSDTMCRIHGLEPQEFDGRLETAVAFFHPDDLPGFQAGARRVIEQGVFTPAEYRIRLRNGVERFVRASGEVIFDPAGKPHRCIGTVIDVTERHNLEEQLRQAQKMEAIGQLAGGVAHDFNNLLTVISGYCELLLSMTAADDKRRNMLEDIRRAGDRATALTRQLLAFSRRQILEPRVLDLNAAVLDIEKMLQRLIAEDVRFLTVLRPEIHMVKVDPGQIGQVIMNLAVNAQHAMPHGGTLTIETRNVAFDEQHRLKHPEFRPGEYVTLTVSDTGTGMTPEVKARIFEPFFTTKGTVKGTGLGLAVVHGIVKQSGGHIEVESAVGVGTTFRIFLPAVHERPERDPDSNTVRPTYGTETILLVDRNDAVRDLAALALQRCGYTVLRALGARDALQIMNTRLKAIDLLLTDVVMVELDGRKLAESLRSRFPGLKTLYLNSYTDDTVAREDQLQAGEATLQKPFTPTALAQRVREVLDGK